MQNDDLERQCNTVLSSSQDKGARKTYPVGLTEKWKSEREAAIDRTSEIAGMTRQLKTDIDATRKEIERIRGNIGRRKSDLASASNGIDARRSRLLDETERSMQMTRYKWNRGADSMAATRAFLCEEAARLYGLRQVKKGNLKRYELGGIDIVDLHAMNSAFSSTSSDAVLQLTWIDMTPEAISTSLAHISHMLMLASHYLSIRLPAEITLPHRDYPRPTIFSLASSYRHGEVSFPGSGLPPMDARGGDQQHTPRARPLFIDKPLPVLAKEDASTYALFLEGVALLAYNIAWACCTQGVSFGDRNSYDDVCNMGQNLWRLLIGDQLHRKPVEPTFPPTLTSLQGSPKDDGPAEIGKGKAQIGRWSHGTTHTFLGGAEGTELVRNFKLLNPTKLVDRLKKKLSSEAPMLEWEKIDGEEARAGEQDFDDGVIVRGHRRGGEGRRNLGIESVMTVQTVEAGPDDEGSRDQDHSDVPAERKPSAGTSGWTKLKSR
jgi:hypothetical protein